MPCINRRHPKVCAFTLIEVVVVISTLAVALPVITLILFAILRQQLAVARMSEVKRQGDQAITYVQNLFERRITKIYASDATELCNIAGSTIQDVGYVTDEDGNKYTLTVTGNALYLNTELVSGQDSSEMLTDNTKVRVEPVESGVSLVQCLKNRSYTRPIVGVQYSIVPAGTMSSDERENLRMHFFTKLAVNLQ